MSSVNQTAKNYLPAAGQDWLLPLYDPLVKLIGVDRLRNTLLTGAAIRPGHRILDIGCGTGTLVTLIKLRYSDVEVIGLDPDPKALARAARKARRANVAVQLDQGFSNEFPYSDAFFDSVFSSFMFHHVEPAQKAATLREVLRTLKPGGELHLLDFGGSTVEPKGFLARLLHSHHRLKDNFGDRILVLMEQAGFTDSHEVFHRRTFFGQTAYYRATALTG